MKRRNGYKPKMPRVEGYLDKLRSTTANFGSWARGYYSLNASQKRLECFAGQDKTNPIGSENLSKISGVRAVYDHRRFR